MLSRPLRLSAPTQLLKFPFFCNGKRKITPLRENDWCWCETLPLALSSGSQMVGEFVVNSTFPILFNPVPHVSDSACFMQHSEWKRKWQNSLHCLIPCPSVEPNVGRGIGEKAGDEEECGAVSQSVSRKGDYAELGAVIEHRRARPHLHLSLLQALIGSCTWNATSVESMLWAGTNNPVAPGRPAIL